MLLVKFLDADWLPVKTTILLLFLNYAALAQDSRTPNLFQTIGKGKSYYIDIRDSVASVFEMGVYFDKAGSGHSIRKTDTLYQQPNGIYGGKSVKIVQEDDRYYLIKENKKVRKVPIVPVQDLHATFSKLNNAFYLDSYFKMADSLNKRYPLNHHSFREGFYTWEKLDNKEQDYLLFRDFTNRRMKEIKDSVRQLQERYVARTSYLTNNLKLLDYNILCDSLVKLPATYRSSSWYYGTVVNEVARQKPEYFFRLAADYPNNRSLLFIAVDDDEETIRGLKNIQGNDEVKREFFKDRRFGKTMPYRILGTYLIIGGLLAWLIVGQP